LQVYLKLWIDDFQAVIPDSKDHSIELFSLFVRDFELVSDKKSNYVTEVTYSASDFSSRFGNNLGIPEKYLNFIQLPSNIDSQTNLLDLDISSKSDKLKPFNGRMKVTPDSKKEIEFIYEKANFVVFNFIIRFIVELLSIDEIPDHPGFEGVAGVINFQLRIKDLEACFLSGEESCLVVKGKLKLF
jgi:hypothetical protein